jgi:competence ComEA-like helix-hairpin-helix protein
MLHKDFISMPKELHKSLIELSDIYSQQTLIVRKKILKDLSRDVTATDGPGFVYGFIIPYDKNLRTSFNIKLGRTTRDQPQKRIDEWGGIQIFSLKSSYNIRYERLIHLFFDNKNFSRPNKEKSKSYEVEWFRFHGIKYTDVVHIVLSILDVVETVFNKSNEFIKDIKISPHVNETNNFVNINTAHELDLIKLPKISLVKAKNIIDYRTKYGNFKTVIAITNVKGIGDGIYSNIVSFISV